MRQGTLELGSRQAAGTATERKRKTKNRGTVGVGLLAEALNLLLAKHGIA
jgi:hypothetical protein